MQDRYRQESRREWEQARRKVFWAKLRAHLKDQPLKVLNFTEVAQRFQLRNSFYRGLQTIPLAKIVGSLGRYDDFVQAFLPTTEAMAGRWQTIASLYLDPNQMRVPPIEVYQVGDAYFVKDGNHRVSVANQLGLIDIEAYVWQYPESVAGLADSRDLEAAVLETERQAFLTQTGLAHSRPDCDICLTVAGGYETMLGQILYYQYVLSQIDGQEMTFEKAAEAWYTMLYQSTIQLIAESGILACFPKKTPADFFVWVTEHHRELEAETDQPVFLAAATRDLEKQHRPLFPLRIWRRLQAWLKRSLNFQPRSTAVP